MSETELEEGLIAASARFDRALARLDTSTRELSARMQRHQRIEVDTQRLVHERARLATELDQTPVPVHQRAAGAHEVSRRLVEAMESVRSVLQKAD